MKTIGNLLLGLGAIAAGPVPLFVLLTDAPRWMWAVIFVFGLQAILAGAFVKRYPASGATLSIMAPATILAMWQAHQGNVMLLALILAVQAPLVLIVQHRGRAQSA